MPGPFPGMDPYLEDPVLWPDLHHRLITYGSEALNGVLPSHYVAKIDERVYVASSARSIYPDMIVIEHRPPPVPVPQDGGVAVAVAAEAPWIITVRPERMREAFIEILSVRGERRVVTVLEVLSPANKTAGHEGRDLYLQKQRESLSSEANFVEIDLLRQGEHTVAPPLHELRVRGRWDYLASVHRADQRWTFYVWPNTLRERLPVIRIPLASGDADVELDLQAVLDRAYDSGAYLRDVDYRTDPTPPLSEEVAKWADALLREKGLRP